MSFWGRVLATGIPSETPNEFLSGYEVEFVNAVDEDLFCSICKLPLRKPVQTRCGHRFCKGCINKVCERQNSGNPRFNCPVCRASQSRKEDVFPDNAVERKILSLVIKCPNRKCKWTGELRDREKHLENCPEKVVKCASKNCTEKMAVKDLENHLTTCQWRMIRCRHCGMQIPVCQLSPVHYLECKKIPVDCPNNCGETIPREETRRHLTCCPEEVVKCTSRNCTETMARKNLEEHVATTCQWRLLRCEHCGLQHPACQQLDHQLKCIRFPVNCPKNCGKVIPRNEIKAHTETDCPLALVSCSYAKMGCPAKVLRKGIDSHIQSALGNHLDLACDKLIKTSDENEKLKKTTEKLEEKLRKYDQIVATQKKLEQDTFTIKTQAANNVTKLEEKLRNTLKEHEQLKERTRKIEEKLDLRKYDQIVATQKKLEQDTFTIKTQLANKVTKRETLDMISEKTRGRESGLDRRLPNSQDSKFLDDLNRAKSDLRREIDTVRNVLDQDIDNLYKEISRVENTLHNKIDDKTRGRESGLDRRLPNSQDSKFLDDLHRAKSDLHREIDAVRNVLDQGIDKLNQKISCVENTLHKKIDDGADRHRRDIADAVSQQVLPFALVASQANRPAPAPQVPQMQQFMYMWYAACGWR